MTGFAAAAAGAGARSVASVAGAEAPGVCGGCSTGFVVVPGRLKFCSSRGPIASVAGVLVVAGAAVSWANAGTGASHSPPASNIDPKRKPALIQLPLCA